RYCSAFFRAWSFGSPLFAKLIAAYNLETDATAGDPLPDGIVGRAVDRAIEDVLPYATHRPGGWYNMDVSPKTLTIRLPIRSRREPPTMPHFGGSSSR